jgi:serine/threonine protein kinase
MEELACGHAPSRGRRPDILKRTILDDSPSLDATLGYSKHMREFVDACLNKNPGQRPTAERLAGHAWMRHAKKPSYLAENLLGTLSV